MGKQRLVADEVDMLSVDFEVVDTLWSRSGEFAGEAFGFAVERQQTLADFHLADRHELLTVHRPEQVVVGDSDRGGIEGGRLKFPGSRSRRVRSV